MNKSLVLFVIGAAVTCFPLAVVAFTPMSEAELKATTGQAADASAESSTEELLQAYYDTFGHTISRLPGRAYGESGGFTNSVELGDLGIVNWGLDLLNTIPNATPSILAAIRRFNTSGGDMTAPFTLPQAQSVIMELPKLVIIAPKTSYTIVLSSDDTKSFGAVSREASLMAIQSGIVEISGN